MDRVTGSFMFYVYVLWSSDHSCKQMVSGVCHTADTIHFEKLAAIHASNSLTLTQTPLNYHLSKFRARKNKLYLDLGTTRD